MSRSFSNYTSKRIGIWLLVVIALAVAEISSAAAPSGSADMAGDWNGVLAVGNTSLHLTLHVMSDKAGKLGVTLDSVDQAAFGLAGADVQLVGDKFSFRIPSVSGSYAGTLNGDRKTIDGDWTQNGTLPLTFTRAATVVRKPSVLAGDWYSATVIGGEPVRVALHVKVDPAGALRVTFDNIDQKTFGLVADDVTFNGASLAFKVPAVCASYSGALSDDGNSLKGEWGEDIVYPVVFNQYRGGPTPTAIPTPEPAPARPPVALDDLKPVLDREMEPVLQRGLLSKASGGGGVVIGVIQHGKRQVFAYGAAKPDSIFEIGSITKTFTGLILAQMVVQKKVTLDEPVQSLLPSDFATQSKGPQITLLDLITHHSGLPRMPDNFKPKDAENPFADYDAPHLREYLLKRGFARPEKTCFRYSNLGVGLLGFALANRAGVPYRQLLNSEVITPLHLHDTTTALSPAQKLRLIQGFDGRFDPVKPWDMDALAGAGALKSTADDLLTYLDANLHPENYAKGAAAGSPASSWPAAVAIDHKVRANVALNGEHKIALAWGVDEKTGIYGHGGGTFGYTSMVGFDPANDLAVVTLYNRSNIDDLAIAGFAPRLNQNIFELMTGKPALPIDTLSENERTILIPPSFTDDSILGAYHCWLTAFSLPGEISDPFKPTATGDIHIVSDGKGKFTQGTWSHHLDDLKLTCNLNLVSGDYSINRDGTGKEHVSWKLDVANSPRGCFAFFSPARPPVTSEPQLIVTDTSGKSVYSTSINPYSILSVACQRETTH